MNELLLCKDIKKTYKSGEDNIEVLKNINLVVYNGDTISITGPSGAGKSTLLHILGGLEKPSEGSVYFNNQSIYKGSDERIAEFRNKHFGFVFQFHHLLSDFTALENVIIPLLISGIEYSKALSRGEKILKDLELSHRLNHKPNKLSGGERQRVAVARALINNPDILFLDEPTGNLDPDHSDEVIELIESLGNITFILVTHNYEVAKIAKRKYNLEQGELKEYEMR
ncbi:ABC transporter ATP-binding protein [candidate division WOR-3 bacterium]|nr:ABC transporter ATP-binding protein [candidate division WOR-3 bacterium]